LARDEIFDAQSFLHRFLAERNLILNVSAVVWRRDALAAALERCGEELAGWRLAGDWRIYLEVLAASSGHVAYIAEALNTHRRHDASATNRVDSTTHLAEVSRMHACLRSRLAPDASLRQRQVAYIRTLRQQFRRPPR
jgi:hypothetical protein